MHMSLLHAHAVAVFRGLDVGTTCQLLGLLAAAFACLLTPWVKAFYIAACALIVGSDAFLQPVMPQCCLQMGISTAPLGSRALSS